MDFNGYKLIDLGGVDIGTNGAKQVTGIYDRLKSNHGVAILIGNFLFNEVMQCAAFVQCVVNSNGSYTFTYNGKTITIASDDTVTVA